MVSINLIVHGLLAILFIGIRLSNLAALEAMDSCVFATSLFLLRRKKYLSAMLTGAVDNTVSSAIVSLALGWASQFGFYIVAAAVVIVNSRSQTLRVKIIEAAVICSVFVGLLIFTADGFRVYTLDPEAPGRLQCPCLLRSLHTLSGLR